MARDPDRVWFFFWWLFLALMVLLISPVVFGQSVNPPEPVWVEIPASRQVSASQLGSVYASIEARMPAQHHYRDSNYGTSVHETTHGLNSQLRMQFSRQGHQRHNCFFLPDRYCCLIYEPSGITLSAVAAAVPASWRGQSYPLYLRQMTAHWNNEPTYILDEWTAYTNSMVALYERHPQDTTSLSSPYSAEFMGYALTLVAISANTQGPQQLQAFVGWYSRHVVLVWSQIAGRRDVSRAYRHLHVLRTSPDGQRIRDFARSLYGEAWAAEVFGTSQTARMTRYDTRDDAAYLFLDLGLPSPGPVPGDVWLRWRLRGAAQRLRVPVDFAPSRTALSHLAGLQR